MTYNRVAQDNSTTGSERRSNEYERRLRELLTELARYNLTGKVKQDSKGLRGTGGSCDVYTGRYGNKTVAIKKLRVHSSEMSNDSLLRSLIKELRVWSNLHHENILPLIGFIVEENKLPSFISEWMKNGTISTFLVAHPDSDIYQLSKGIASGLLYLHSQDIVHSDVKCANVLVSADGQPQLTDFGISRIMAATKTNTTTLSMKGTCRWMAIELFGMDSAGTNDSSTATPRKSTFETDVWAFGMTVYELLTKNVPYVHITMDPQIISRIMRYELPHIPESTNAIPADQQTLWALCQRCWRKQPSLRPSMNDVVCEIFSESYMKECVSDPLYKEGIPDLTEKISEVRNGPRKNTCLGRIADERHGKEEITIRILPSNLSYREKEASLSSYNKSRFYLRFFKHFFRDCLQCKSLVHHNIVPFLGLAFLLNIPGSIACITPHYRNGNARGYITSKGYSVEMCLKLVVDIVEGLLFLHNEKNIIHGRLSIESISISDDGDACISDTMLARWLSDKPKKLDEDEARGIAPELLNSPPNMKEIMPATEESDIYAFSIIALEIMSGSPAFCDLQNVSEILVAVSRGSLPERSLHGKCPQQIWSLLAQCWVQPPRNRPNARELLAKFEEIAISMNIVLPHFVTIDDLEQSDTLTPPPSPSGSIARCPFIKGLDMSEFSWKLAGSSSAIHEGQTFRRSDTQPYKIACRHFLHARNNASEMKKRLVKEAVRWARLRHKHVAIVLGLHESSNPLPMIVMQYYPENNLVDYLKGSDEVTDQSRECFVSQIALGLAYLHEFSIIHGSLRPSKVLLAGKNHVVVSGAGLYHLFDKDPRPGRLEEIARYEAPERLKSENESRTKESDCWSFSMTALEILTGRIPFSRFRPIEVRSKLLEGLRPKRTIDGVRKHDDNAIPEELWSILDQCWKDNPADRKQTKWVSDKCTKRLRGPLVHSQQSAPSNVIVQRDRIAERSTTQTQSAILDLAKSYNKETPLRSLDVGKLPQEVQSRPSRSRKVTSQNRLPVVEDSPSNSEDEQTAATPVSVVEEEIFEERFITIFAADLRPDPSTVNRMRRAVAELLGCRQMLTMLARKVDVIVTGRQDDLEIDLFRSVNDLRDQADDTFRISKNIVAKHEEFADQMLDVLEQARSDEKGNLSKPLLEELVRLANQLAEQGQELSSHCNEIHDQIRHIFKLVRNCKKSQDRVLLWQNTLNWFSNYFTQLSLDESVVALAGISVSAISRITSLARAADIEKHFDKVDEFFTVTIVDRTQNAEKVLVAFQFEHLMKQLGIRLKEGNRLRMTKVDVDTALNDWLPHLVALTESNGEIRQMGVKFQQMFGRRILVG